MNNNKNNNNDNKKFFIMLTLFLIKVEKYLTCLNNLNWVKTRKRFWRELWRVWITFCRSTNLLLQEFSNVGRTENNIFEICVFYFNGRNFRGLGLSAKFLRLIAIYFRGSKKKLFLLGIYFCQYHQRSVFLRLYCHWWERV